MPYRLWTVSVWLWGLLVFAGALWLAAPVRGKSLVFEQEPHGGGRTEARTSQGDFLFQIDAQAAYSFSRDGKTWLKSGPSFLYTDGQRYGTDDGTLQLTNATYVSGMDSVGQWVARCFLYRAGQRAWQLCAKTWPWSAAIVPSNTVIFQQHFIDGTNNSARVSPDYVTSAFPAFLTPRTDDKSLGLLAYQGNMFGGSNHYVSVWNAGGASFLSGGIVGGPVAIFGQPDGVCIMAPFSEFMSSSRYLDGNGRLNWGVMGGVKSVPAGFVQQTIVQCSGGGINQVFSEWGKFMRTYYNKDEVYRRSDLTLKYLGYWTDGGAYYYYNTELNKTYEQTMLDVKTYTDSVAIPFRYVQYDSWFYPKGIHGGTLTWNATKSIAPDGFQYLYNKNQWPAGAHNRYWSSQTPYAKLNGGKYNFIVEKEKAIPQDLNFWMDLFRESRLWGLIMYEQDWLDREFGDMNATLSTVDVAKIWLEQMGQAARANSLTIQYCMSNPRHALQSLQIPVVTQARVSDDYRAGSDQWRIGEISIFADAIGIAPFKDTFWTTKVQPGNIYNLEEPNSELQAVVATLSTGPVGPGDMIGHTNVSMLLQCCRDDGMVLRPDRPAMAIDKQFWQQAWGSGLGPVGEVWTTFSQFGENYFGIILAAAMDDVIPQAFNITPRDAGFFKFSPMVVMTRATRGETPYVYNFTDAAPLLLTNQCTRANFCMFYTSPVYSISSQTSSRTHIFIYGEMDKFVPMSRDRVTDILLTIDDVIVTLQGAAGEATVFSNFMDGEFVRHSCTFDQSGSASLSLKDARTSCGT